MENIYKGNFEKYKIKYLKEKKLIILFIKEYNKNKFKTRKQKNN